MARKPLLPPQTKKGKKGQLIAKKQSPITKKVLKARAHLCDMLELIHDVNSKEAKAGNRTSKQVAAEAKKDGKKWGCSWA